MNATAATNLHPDECLLRPGNTNCGGCGMSIGLTRRRHLHSRDPGLLRGRHRWCVSNNQLWRTDDLNDVRIVAGRGVGRCIDS